MALFTLSFCLFKEGCPLYRQKFGVNNAMNSKSE